MEPEFWLGCAIGTVFGHVLASLVLYLALAGMLKLHARRDERSS